MEMTVAIHTHTHKSSDRPNGMGCMDENGGMNHNIHRQIKTFKSVKSKGKRKLIHTHTQVNVTDTDTRIEES